MDHPSSGFATGERLRLARARPWVLAMAAALLGASALAQTASPGAPLPAARIAEIVASPDRTDADRINDVRRKPAEVLAFIAPRTGMTVLDVSSGGGYTTELLARSVGPGGKVYAQVPRAAGSSLSARLARFPQIALVVQPFDNPVPPAAAPGTLDLVTLMFNYHDLGPLGLDRDKLNKAVFAALKPGGTYVLADHAARPGAGISEANTTHRIEESFLRAEVERAGFRLAATGDFLRNPNDPRDKETPEPAQPKDEFVLKFVKP